jgi:hypothetical protein
MKGKIKSDGTLRLYRPSWSKDAMCPFATDFQDSANYPTCGDWCPLFGEPVVEKTGYAIPGGGIDYRHDGKFKLELCKKTLYFDEFIDERIKKEKE